MPWGNSVIAYKSRVLLAILIFFFPFQQHMDSFQQYLFNYQKERDTIFKAGIISQWRERSVLLLASLCGRIPLIFQCIYKQRAAKLRAEKCLCNILNNQVKILHLPRAQFTPVNEASPPVVSEEMLQISAFYVIERGKKKKRKKKFHFHTGIVWETRENSELALTIFCKLAAQEVTFWRLAQGSPFFPRPITADEPPFVRVYI